jgi:hypothetical protein
MLFFAAFAAMGQANNSFEDIKEHYDQGKIGGKNDDHPFARQIYAYIDRVVRTNEDDARAVAYYTTEALIERTDTHFEKVNFWERFPTLSVRTNIQACWQLITNSLKTTRSDLQYAESITNGLFSAAWNIKRASMATLYGDMSFRTLSMNVKSQAANPQENNDALEEVAEMIRTAELEYAGLQPLKDLRLGDFERKITHLDKQWKAYMDRMRAETIIDSSVNNWAYGRTAYKSAFNPPPSYQMIALHPTPGYEFSGIHNKDMNPAIFLEIVGINILSFSTNREIAKCPFGVSLAGSYAVGQKEDARWGAGLLFSVDSAYSFGVMVNDPGGKNEFVAAINLDLWKLYEGKSDKAKKYLKYVGIDVGK